MSDSIGALLNLASNLRLGPWAWGLQPASWRGVPFAVRRSSIRRGRRVAVHEYPRRDDVWVEDLGRGTRQVSFDGFLIGTDVFAQRDAMVAAAEKAGQGDLVHPSLGTLQASLIEFSAGERFDLGRVVELQFSFIQGADKPLFPSDSFASQLQSGIAAVQCAIATAQSYISTVTTVFGALNAAVTFSANIYATAFGIVSGFATLAGATASGPAMISGSVKGLSGNNGRYANGGLASLQPTSVTVATALASVVTARVAVAAAVATVSATDDPSLLPAAVQGLTEAVRQVAIDPTDQIKLISSLAAYRPVIAPGSASLGQAVASLQAAMSALCRQAALISLANAAAGYQPTTYNDAIAQLDNITALLDAEILAAADTGDTMGYNALRALRTAVTADLIARGAKLPRLVTVSRAGPLPSLVLAYQLYADATRSDDLIARADPIDPLFMPTSFVALSS